VNSSSLVSGLLSFLFACGLQLTQLFQVQPRGTGSLTKARDSKGRAELPRARPAAEPSVLHGDHAPLQGDAASDLTRRDIQQTMMRAASRHGTCLWHQSNLIPSHPP